ncbi:Eco57I restriction-modification methylase domain-containing protein [uncultured Demequina sp.]|uniref:Eco57I restriction-modification methylase domain-containing protein n=1 Tax=uncultured Demequina sp. TaxID=693499 RepID=UPI0025D89734|nr:DNA methyltransferase [uncultured Demequina sp.]
MLVLAVDAATNLREPGTDGWAASPIDRMEHLLRENKVPVGVVTDGRWWGLVSAPEDALVASGIVDAQTWIEEPDVRDGFLALLSPIRLAGGKPEERTAAIFADSVTAAEDLTVALGTQVRRAVELLVGAFSDGLLSARETGKPDPLPADRHRVYDAAVTVMMRVVFLLFAEDRAMMPQSALYVDGYGMGGQLRALERRLNHEDAESLDATSDTWHRLLATSRALYEGVSAEDMRLPSYGGSLFDPSRFEFLESRDEVGALAVTVSDRVMLEVLRALQYATIGGQRRPVSFRDVDVEQIGYIYEGLLGYTAREVDETTLGLLGREGEEPEIPLETMEGLAAESPDLKKLSQSVLAWVKASQPAAKAPSGAALAKALAADIDDDAERALVAVTRDLVLRDRLRPFAGAVRRDLRDRMVVIPVGGLIVAETPSRATSGAHYTPKDLAREVVLHALEPVVYQPGPYQTPNRDEWRLLSSDQILNLKVADIACGSGAFLVSAAEYLADKVIEAWTDEGVASAQAEHLRVRARRQVVARCLYGADINGMAVEMCKISLWLVSLDPDLPFSFVDDKVLHGNSLLGITSTKQLEALHIDPDAVASRSRSQHAGLLWAAEGDEAGYVESLDVDATIRRAVDLRRNLATAVDDADPQRSSRTKRRLWDEYQETVAQLAHVADGIIAAGLPLGGKPGKKLNEAYESLRIAVDRAYGAGGGDSTMLDSIVDVGLTPEVETDYERWKPLHWPLAVPDVMERGGFDAVIGNPPFLGGQKLTAAVGARVRDWFVNVLAGGTRGSADLVAYFLLRAHSLASPHGSLGLIATNTVAQGDTREVGLDQLVSSGFTIARCVQSRAWPAKSANLEYAALWGSDGAVSELVSRFADGLEVRRISSLLEAAGRIDARPARLSENSGIAFQGCIVFGDGFVLDPSEAEALIKADPKNREVVRPYLNGDDLNSRPDSAPSRWVIDMRDRTLSEAECFKEPFMRLDRMVRPDRAKKTKSTGSVPWWQFLRSRAKMRLAIAGLSEYVAIAQTSNTLMPVRASAGIVPSHALIVFATESRAFQAVVSSSLHQLWVSKYGTTMRKDLRYTPSDVFETFPRPESTDELDEVGRVLESERREIMLRRDLGLTKLYNLVNDPSVVDSADADVARMREIHVQLDEAVMAAYGWDDVPLDHGLHTYRQMERWTVSPAARVEVLDRLLEENLRRAGAQGDAALVEDDDEEEGDVE